MGFRYAVLTVVLLSVVARGQQQPSIESPILPGQAEDFSFLSGRWIKESGPDPADGRYAGALAIYAQSTQITVTRERIPQEVYRVDGIPTQYGDGRLGFGLLVGDGIVLTTGRIRQSPSGPSTTIYTDWYRVEGDVLTVESRRSQTRPDGSLLKMENTRVTLRYRRAL